MKETSWFNSWIKKLQKSKGRLVLGLIFLSVELFCLLGTGVLLSDEAHYLTGEGLWDVEMDKDHPLARQAFVPAFRHLDYISFRMDMHQAVHGDGIVTVWVEDESGDKLFDAELPFYEITDSAYTEIKTELDLDKNKTYYLVIGSETPYEGEYPLLSVCGTEHYLQESAGLIIGEEMTGAQLVSGYRYSDALPASRMCKGIVIALLTALGIILGLPESEKIRRAAGIILLLAAPYVLGTRLELLNFDVSFYLPFAMKWNVGIMYALELSVFLMTHSPAFAVVFTNICLTALYSANYFMRMYRGTSLRMNDFTAIGTATKVAGAYDLSPDEKLAIVWAVLMFFIVWSLQTVTWKRRSRTDEHSRKIPMGKILSYVISVAAAIGILWWGGYKLLYTDYLNEAGFADEGFTGFEHELIYAFDGYLVATCIEVQNSRISPPPGYSAEAVEKILSEAEKAAEDNRGKQQISEDNTDHPHVILIMNESLADLTILDGVELNQDNMPFLRSLQENTIKGFVNASVFGGGTANTEFEVFTGCSTAFFSVNYYPYQQAITRPINSMVSQMKKNGYTAISMHPERSGNWNRQNVYKFYGFDRSLWKEDFPDARIIHSGVSDADTYRKIIDLYESREPGEKLFVFDLTMQNHGGYNMHEEPYAVQALNVHEAQVDEYLSLVKISDDAFKELVEYFEGQDEKVIICMYGDHQPWVSEFLVSDNMKEGSEASEALLKKYRTPVVIWANYDIDELDDCNISMNYLGGLLMRTAGIPTSPYFDYLEQLSKEYPVITTNGYVDAEGVYHGWSGANDEFMDYRMLQYNYLYDDNTVEWGF